MPVTWRFERIGVNASESELPAAQASLAVNPLACSDWARLRFLLREVEVELDAGEH